jgi:hypothetical protein
MSRVMKESDLQAARIMESQGDNANRIIQKLKNDPVACATGIEERNEYNFLYGFSRGYVGIPDEDNDNRMLRLNYGYFDKNTYYATEKGVISLHDILNVIEKASDAGSIITKIWIAKTTYDKLRQTREAKELAANYNGQSFNEETSLPVPNVSKFNEAFADETGGVEFVVVNRSVITESNGKRNSEKPWDENRLIFVTADVVGSFVYGRLAEQDNPVDGVMYSTLDDYKLISRFRETNPLREITTGQAIAAPVIENVDQLFILDLSKSADVDDTAEAKDVEDVFITYNTKKYHKTAFVDALNKISGAGMKATDTDKAVIRAVNKLNEAQLAEFLESVASAVAD